MILKQYTLCSTEITMYHAKRILEQCVYIHGNFSSGNRYQDRMDLFQAQFDLNKVNREIEIDRIKCITGII